MHSNTNSASNNVLERSASSVNSSSSSPSSSSSGGGSFLPAANNPKLYYADAQMITTMYSANERSQLSTFDELKKFLEGSKSVAAGGGAGVIARTASAPLDRIKLLFQVQAMASSGVSAGAYTGVGQAFAKIYKEEGVLSFWKGNGVNVIRVAPYAAAQLTSNDFYKSLLQDEKTGKLGVKERLLAGALAGMTGTALTHPLDTIRLRLALPNHPYKGMVNAFSVVYRTEGVKALYKGLIPTLAGIAPYAACNFASYDFAKQMYYGEGSNIKQDPMANLVIGGASGTFSATVCYPLDTIRRRMQMKGKTYNGMADAMRTIMKDEGMIGFFRGWTANTMKVVPQNSIRFVSYELLKTMLGVQATKI